MCVNCGQALASPDSKYLQHHESGYEAQASSWKQVNSLLTCIIMGNPFLDHFPDLVITLDNWDSMIESVKEALCVLKI